jgi:hypothetical protein
VVGIPSTRCTPRLARPGTRPTTGGNGAIDLKAWNFRHSASAASGLAPWHQSGQCRSGFVLVPKEKKTTARASHVIEPTAHRIRFIAAATSHAAQICGRHIQPVSEFYIRADLLKLSAANRYIRFRVSMNDEGDLTYRPSTSWRLPTLPKSGEIQGAQVTATEEVNNNNCLSKSLGRTLTARPTGYAARSTAARARKLERRTRRASECARSGMRPPSFT